MDLTCKWETPWCRNTFSTAEELFNHLCDCHVGRKRNGNLNLACNWEGCTHSAAKRDHMTSHMMVHCPLQTNVCRICDKTFKRSYDLRKHEVTHTVAHHEAHARSRAVIYKELEIPFGTTLDRSIPVNRSRVYSLPREQPLNWSQNSKPVVSGGTRRGRSFSVARNNPYARRHSENTGLYPSSWKNEPDFCTNRFEGQGSISEEGPHQVNAQTVNQFQFIEQNHSNHSESFASSFPSPRQAPSTSSGRSSYSQQPTAHSSFSENWSDFFNSYNMADPRAASESIALPVPDFSNLSCRAPLGIPRATSLSSQTSYPPTNIPSIPYEALRLRHPWSVPVIHEPSEVRNVEIANSLAFQQPNMGNIGSFELKESKLPAENYQHSQLYDNSVPAWSVEPNILLFPTSDQAPSSNLNNSLLDDPYNGLDSILNEISQLVCEDDPQLMGFLTGENAQRVEEVSSSAEYLSHYRM